ncbi:MAG: hypothetical protein M3P53_01645 [Actinomycetota bacterium]|nr:hypothetical protein [Actinomycetota bacterium]
MTVGAATVAGVVAAGSWLSSPLAAPWRLVVVVAISVAGLGACSGGGSSDSSGANRAWPLFESGEGRFRVALPEEPARHEQDVDEEDLETKAVLFTSKFGDTATVNVSYADYPEAITEIEPRVVLAGAVKGAVNRVSGTLARQTPLTAEGSPAVDYVIEGDEGWLQARAILVGNRLYLLQLAAPRPNAGAFERLVTSFELL